MISLSKKMIEQVLERPGKVITIVSSGLSLELFSSASSAFRELSWQDLGKRDQVCDYRTLEPTFPQYLVLFCAVYITVGIT